MPEEHSGRSQDGFPGEITKLSLESDESSDLYPWPGKSKVINSRLAHPGPWSKGSLLFHFCGKQTVASGEREGMEDFLVSTNVTKFDNLLLFSFPGFRLFTVFQLTITEVQIIFK